MDKDSTTDDSNSTATDTEKDPLDFSVEQIKGNDSTDSTDDDQTADDSDDLTSDDADEDTKKADKAEEDDKSDEKTPAFDADLDEWAEKTGHDKPENDRERKLLQDLRDSKRDFTRERQSKKNDGLDAAIKDAKPKDGKTEDDADPLAKSFSNLEAKFETERAMRLRSEYYRTNDVTSEEDAAMIEIIKETGEKGNQARFAFLSNPDNMSDLHILAKNRIAANSTADKTDETVTKARQEERERIAKESKSGGPSRSAKGNTPPPKKDPLQELWESDD